MSRRSHPIPCLTVTRNSISSLREVRLPRDIILNFLLLTPNLRPGGTTACLVAGRLAAADPSLRILLIEAGPHTQDGLSHIQPAQYLSHLVPGSKTMKFVVSHSSEHLGGRSLVVPGGQCIGGGSSVNCGSCTWRYLSSRSLTIPVSHSVQPSQCI